MIDFITGFNLLPATGEFGYDPLPYRASRWPPSAADRQFKPINTYAAPGSGRTDYSLALDALAIAGQALTGRYLGATDAMDTTTPASIYAVKDPLTSTGWTNVRSAMVAQTLTTSGNNRTVTKNTVDWIADYVAAQDRAIRSVPAAEIAAVIAHTRAKVCCTRKTTPGLRVLEKMAAAAGGIVNHRMGLYDAVLIKNNHIRLGGGVTSAIQHARAAGKPIDDQSE